MTQVSSIVELTSCARAIWAASRQIFSPPPESALRSRVDNSTSLISVSSGSSGDKLSIFRPLISPPPSPAAQSFSTKGPTLSRACKRILWCALGVPRSQQRSSHLRPKHENDCHPLPTRAARFLVAEASFPLRLQLSVTDEFKRFRVSAHKQLAVVKAHCNSAVVAALDHFADCLIWYMRQLIGVGVAAVTSTPSCFPC